MDIGKGLRESIEIYRRNFMTLVLATVIATIGSAVTLGILSVPLMGGLLILCLKLMRGEKPAVNEVFAHFDKFMPGILIVGALWVAAAAMALLAEIPLLGSLIRFIAGPLIWLVFTLATGLVVERGIEAKAALRKAVECIMINPLSIWLYCFVIGLVSGIGALLLVLPVIFTMPIGSVGMAIAYRELVDRQNKLPTETAITDKG